MSRPATAESRRPRGTAPSGARLAALGRAELTLLGRNRNSLALALLMPAAMLFLLRSAVTGMDAADLPMGAGAATLVGGTGLILVLVLYTGLTATYTARREELVLKRLRTGEPTDTEVLVGAALPAAVIALAQCAVLTVGGPALLDVPAPRRPDLLLLGILAVAALSAGLAALTSAVTRTVETAGLSTLPLFLAAVTGSGMLVPREALPDAVGDVCDLLPFSGAMEFVRAGWLGTAGAGNLVQAAVLTLVWAIITGDAVRRWFRWEPRR
ncbi:ABC transporter permease [Streptomyces sp. NRRL S-87]|uniref:ABC transporter permease n=1 Tax=Streptomyces sp. NRRL S-87 TaxID=1463920 RepID=UPI0004C0BF85|nr:ABC transporter permease [Streptomyces sp. NRRL S-87]